MLQGDAVGGTRVITQTTAGNSKGTLLCTTKKKHETIPVTREIRNRNKATTATTEAHRARTSEMLSVGVCLCTVLPQA